MLTEGRQKRSRAHTVRQLNCSILWDPVTGKARPPMVDSAKTSDSEIVTRTHSEFLMHVLELYTVVNNVVEHAF